MTIRGLDSAGRQFGPADKAAGYTLIARYLAGSFAMTAAEVDGITAAGLGILSVWEIQAQAALGGSLQGASDAARAVEAARALKQPQGTAIYTTVDFDPLPQQMSAIGSYIAAFARHVQAFGHLPGLYGGAGVIAEFRVLVNFTWQAAGWSYGVDLPWVDLRQELGTVDVDGTQSDIDTVLNEHCGAWNLEGEWPAVAPEPPPDPVPTPAPVPEPVPAPVPAEDDVALFVHPIDVPTDADGNGFHETIYPWASFRAIAHQGTVSADHYAAGCVHVNEVNGNVAVSVTGAVPSGVAVALLTATE